MTSMMILNLDLSITNPSTPKRKVDQDLIEEIITQTEEIVENNKINQNNVEAVPNTDRLGADVDTMPNENSSHLLTLSLNGVSLLKFLKSTDYQEWILLM